MAIISDGAFPSMIDSNIVEFTLCCDVPDAQQQYLSAEVVTNLNQKCA